MNSGITASSMLASYCSQWNGVVSSSTMRVAADVEGLSASCMIYIVLHVIETTINENKQCALCYKEKYFLFTFLRSRSEECLDVTGTPAKSIDGTASWSNILRELEDSSKLNCCVKESRVKWAEHMRDDTEGCHAGQCLWTNFIHCNLKCLRFSDGNLCIEISSVYAPLVQLILPGPPATQ